MKNKRKVFIKLFLIVLLCSVNSLCISCSNKMKSENQTIEVSEFDKKNIMSFHYDTSISEYTYIEYIYFGLSDSFDVPVIVDVDFNNCYFICCYATEDDYIKIGSYIEDEDEFYNSLVWKIFNSQDEIERYEDLCLGLCYVVGNAKIVKNVLTGDLYDITVPIYMPIDAGCYFRKLPIDTNGFSYYTLYNLNDNYLFLRNFRRTPTPYLKLLKLDGEYYFDIFYIKKKYFNIEEIDQKALEERKISALFGHSDDLNIKNKLSYIQDYFSIYEKEEEYRFIGNLEVVCSSIYNTLLK